jgi:hypothetical protein
VDESTRIGKQFTDGKKKPSLYMKGRVKKYIKYKKNSNLRGDLKYGSYCIPLNRL